MEQLIDHGVHLRIFFLDLPLGLIEQLFILFQILNAISVQSMLELSLFLFHLVGESLHYIYLLLRFFHHL